MTKQQLVHTLKTHSVILQGRTALTGTGDKDCISRFPSFANEPNDETKTATNIGFCASWADGITINFFTNPSFSSSRRITPSNRINNELFIINLAAVMSRRNTNSQPAQSPARWLQPYRKTLK